MDSSTQRISPLRRRMIDDMRMRKLEHKTQEAYIRAVCKLAAFLRRSPDTASVEDLRRFQLHLVDQGTFTDHAERDPDWAEVLVRGHARSRRVDGQDAAGARAAHVAGGLEP